MMHSRNRKSERSGNNEQLTAEAVGFESSSVFEACAHGQESEGMLTAVGISIYGGSLAADDRQIYLADRLEKKGSPVKDCLANFRQIIPGLLLVVNLHVVSLHPRSVRARGFHRGNFSVLGNRYF
jgi:hypothetical protein